MKITVNKKAEKKFKNGYPLVQKEDLVSVPQTDNWIIFQTDREEYLGTGYLGKQNKGIGWILTNKVEEMTHDFFVKRLSTAKKLRQNYFFDEETTAFRVVNGEGDQLGGLIIDWYDGYVVFSWYNDTFYHHRKMILEAFNQVFPEAKGIYEKIRFESLLPESAFVSGQKAPEPFVIRENGIRYATYMDDGLMTGIFLDQKEVRGRLSEGFAAGKRILNMFSYTGAFSVAAAMGGALETTSVDLANRSKAKTTEQFDVNDLASANQKIHVMDTFEYFKFAQRKQLQFDVIVLDPPSFARNKKKVFSVSKNYGELIEQSLDLLARNGWIIASTNAANLSIEKFERQIEEAFEKKQVQYKKESVYRLPEDFVVYPKFEEGNYLKVIFYQRIN